MSILIEWHPRHPHLSRREGRGVYGMRCVFSGNLLNLTNLSLEMDSGIPGILPRTFPCVNAVKSERMGRENGVY